MATTAEMLTSVETAIAALVSGQVEESAIDGTRFRLTDLDKLRAWRRELKAEIASESTTRRISHVSFENFR